MTVEIFSNLHDSTAPVAARAKIPSGRILRPFTSGSLSPPGSAFPEAQKTPPDAAAATAGRAPSGSRQQQSHARLPTPAALRGAALSPDGRAQSALPASPAAAPSPCPAPRGALEPGSAKPDGRSKASGDSPSAASSRSPLLQSTHLLRHRSSSWPPPCSGTFRRHRPPSGFECPAPGREERAEGRGCSTAPPSTQQRCAPGAGPPRNYPSRGGQVSGGKERRGVGWPRFIGCQNIWHGIRSTPAARAQTLGWTFIEREGHKELQTRAWGLLAARGSSGHGTAADRRAVCARATHKTSFNDTAKGWAFHRSQCGLSAPVGKGRTQDKE